MKYSFSALPCRAYASKTHRFGSSQPLPNVFAGDPLDIAYRASLKQFTQQSQPLQFSSWSSTLLGLSGALSILRYWANGVIPPLWYKTLVISQFLLGGATHRAHRRVEGNLHTLHYLLTGKPLFGLHRLPKLAKEYRSETLPALVRQAKRRYLLFATGGGIVGERVGHQVATARGWEGVKGALVRTGGAGAGALGGLHLAHTLNTIQRQMAQRKLLAALRIIF